MSQSGRRPRILSISYSTLLRDARVLRQLEVLARHGEVTSLGYGEAPSGIARHLRLPDGAASLPRTASGVPLLATRMLRRAEMAAPGLKKGRDLIGDERFDLVVANDARAIPLAMEVADGAPVWCDMHEWAAEEFSHVTTWRLLVAPLMDHIAHRYLPQAAAVTTVCQPLADRYAERYGIAAPLIVRNAGPYRADLSPTPVRDDVLRVVHSGGAVPGRNLEMLIEAVIEIPHATLDLYLVGAGDGGGYLDKLTRLAAGHDRIALRDPVAPDELPATLNAYDVGAFCMPPINVNAEYALPNKFFDFVQARLAQAVGPAPEMARLVRQYDLGVVSEDFSKDSFVRALRELDPQRVRDAKDRSHEHARTLSSERDVAVEDELIERLLAHGAG
jgi:glycosyltransferase involved in cell wall biosynthesis